MIKEIAIELFWLACVILELGFCALAGCLFIILITQLPKVLRKTLSK